jgi:hypothetical protein
MPKCDMNKDFAAMYLFRGALIFGLGGLAFPIMPAAGVGAGIVGVADMSSAFLLGGMSANCKK